MVDIANLAADKKNLSADELQGELDDFRKTGSSVKTINAYANLVAEKARAELQAAEDIIKGLLGPGYTVKKDKKMNIEPDPDKPSIVRPTWRIYKNG